MTTSTPPSHRSSLVTWTLLTFFFFTGIALLESVLALAAPKLVQNIVFVAASMCLGIPSLAPLVLSVFLLVFARSKGYHPAVKTVALTIIGGYVVGFVVQVVLGGMMLAVTLQPGGKTDLMESLSKMAENHPVLYAATQISAIVIDLTQVVIIVLAVKAMGGNHFAPRPLATPEVAPPAPPPTPPAEQAA